MTAGYAATSDARKRNAEAAQSATDAATVAAVLWSHRTVVVATNDGWHVVCRCGHNELGDDPLPHVAAALLAAPPIAQALAAVEAVARVEALIVAAEERDAASLHRTFNGDSFGAWLPTTDLRAALRPGDPK